MQCGLLFNNCHPLTTQCSADWWGCHLLLPVAAHSAASGEDRSNYNQTNSVLLNFEFKVDFQFQA